MGTRTWSDRLDTQHVPDWLRRGIRLSIALLVFTSAARGVFKPNLPEEYLDEYERGCVWAAVTAIVVNAPIVGRAAQTSMERTLGTVAGGIAGFMAYDLGASKFPDDSKWETAYLVLMTVAAGMLSCYLAMAWSLDMTPRFFCMTFLMTTMSAPAHDSALLVAALRTGAIVVGVLTMQLLGILILPRSASVEAYRDLQRALTKMCELNDLVWESNDLTCPGGTPHCRHNGDRSASGRHVQPNSGQSEHSGSPLDLTVRVSETRHSLTFGATRKPLAARQSSDGAGNAGGRTPVSCPPPRGSVSESGANLQPGSTAGGREGGTRRPRGSTNHGDHTPSSPPFTGAGVRAGDATSPTRVSRVSRADSYDRGSRGSAVSRVDSLGSPGGSGGDTSSDCEAGGAGRGGRQHAEQTQRTHSTAGVWAWVRRCLPPWGGRRQRRSHRWSGSEQGGAAGLQDPLLGGEGTGHRSSLSPFSSGAHLSQTNTGKLRPPGIPKVSSVSSLRGLHGGASSAVLRQRSQECEAALAGVYTCLGACEENVKLSAGEVYVWHFWGHFMFLPGIPNLGRLYTRSQDAPGACGRWHLQSALVVPVLTSLRRLSRLLWNAHLSLVEEFTPELQESVTAMYPPGLLPRLARAYSASLRALCAAFPGAPGGAVDTSALSELADVLQELQAASDAQHRMLVERLTHNSQARLLAARSIQRSTTMAAHPTLPMLPSVLAYRAAATFLPPGQLSGMHGRRSGRVTPDDGDTDGGQSAPSWLGPSDSLSRKHFSLDKRTWLLERLGRLSSGPVPAPTSPLVPAQEEESAGGREAGAGGAPVPRGDSLGDPMLTPSWMPEPGGWFGGASAHLRAHTTPQDMPPSTRRPDPASQAWPAPGVGAAGQGLGPDGGHGAGTGGGSTAAVSAPPLNPPRSPSTAFPRASSDSMAAPTGSLSFPSAGGAANNGLAGSRADSAGDVLTPTLTPVHSLAPGSLYQGPPAPVVAPAPAPPPGMLHHALLHRVPSPGQEATRQRTAFLAGPGPSIGIGGGGGGGGMVSGSRPGDKTGVGARDTQGGTGAGTGPGVRDSAAGTAPTSGAAAKLRALQSLKAAHGLHPYSLMHPGNTGSAASTPRRTEAAATGHAGAAPSSPGLVRLASPSLGPGLMFSATPAGHIAQVRWASFEWLCDQLGDELEELYATTVALMAALPYPL